MKLTPRKNQYGHEVVDCPFCAQWIYVRDVTKISPDPLRDLKRHISNAAKSEALSVALGELIKETQAPHLEYFTLHTKPKVMPIKNKREYDNDLTI